MNLELAVITLQFFDGKLKLKNHELVKIDQFLMQMMFSYLDFGHKIQLIVDDTFNAYGNA